MPHVLECHGNVFTKLFGEPESSAAYLQPGCEGTQVTPQALHLRCQNGLPHAQLLVLHLRST